MTIILNFYPSCHFNLPLRPTPNALMVKPKCKHVHAYILLSHIHNTYMYVFCITYILSLSTLYRLCREMTINGHFSLESMCFGLNITWLFGWLGWWFRSPKQCYKEAVSLYYDLNIMTYSYSLVFTLTMSCCHSLRLSSKCFMFCLLKVLTYTRVRGLSR